MLRKSNAQQVKDSAISILGYEQAAGSKKWGVIPMLTLKAVEEKTQPKVNGRDDGQNNYPGAGDTELSKTEKNILFEAESFLGKTKDFINKYLTDIARKMAGIADSGVADSFYDLKIEPQKEFNKYQVHASPELIKLRVSERKARRDLNRFKADHHLQRNAVYPESYVKHFAVLFAFLLAECIANTYFFSANSDLGYLGGFFQALVVSIANVGLSYVFGWFGFTQLNHRNLMRKFIGGLSAIFYLGAIGTFHLLIAHYRDLLTIDPDNAIMLTLTRFRQDTFALDSLESVIVFVIGAIISILAVGKGYAHDDRYPGYGAVDRLHKDAERAYNQKEAEVRDTLVNLISESERKVGSRLVEREERIKKMEDLLSGAKSVIAHIDNIDNQVADVVNTAIMNYREANKSVRTEAIPGYFMTAPTLNNKLNKGCDILMLENLEQIVSGAKTELETTRANAQKVIEELFEESHEISRTIDDLADQVDRKALKRVVSDEKTGSEISQENIQASSEIGSKVDYLADRVERKAKNLANHG
ncbi:uncharacterized protein Dvar_51600 [Desulfosarcina variabilis str. Montpellier]|uniref:hypothetical protein n=1 Tax=Desulfosarcina variabilis TaxID=2300 RepID=UPI003AFAD738